MKFHDETFAKGFIHNGILVGLVRYFTTEGHLINITDISMTTSKKFFYLVYIRVKNTQSLLLLKSLRKVQAVTRTCFDGFSWNSCVISKNSAFVVYFCPNVAFWNSQKPQKEFLIQFFWFSKVPKGGIWHEIGETECHAVKVKCCVANHNHLNWHHLILNHHWLISRDDGNVHQQKNFPYKSDTNLQIRAQKSWVNFPVMNFKLIYPKFFVKDHQLLLSIGYPCWVS